MTQADDLGRVVIPKEIRRTMRIREGDPLEIFTDREGEVIFKKYSPIGELGDFALQYAEALNRVCGLSIAVCDRDAVIAVSGLPKKGFSERRISDDVGKLTDGLLRQARTRSLNWCRLRQSFSENSLRADNPGKSRTVIDIGGVMCYNIPATGRCIRAASRRKVLL